MCSLAVLELYLCQRVLGSLDILRFSVPCEYFSFKYGSLVLIGENKWKLPDFDM